ncbi:DoxX family protein [Nostoc ellipsosporum NOK]|nr:DoxX family protein [Nostoc ellipsosporum NOK]
MKKTKILYWVFTGLFCFMMLGSAIPDIISSSMAVKGFQDIQMPTYLLPFLGVAKALGVMAVLIPGYPRIKEWAYAGLFFDLAGAMYSIAAAGHPVQDWAFVAIPILLGVGSYIFYHRKSKVAEPQMALAA